MAGAWGLARRRAAELPCSPPAAAGALADVPPVPPAPLRPCHCRRCLPTRMCSTWLSSTPPTSTCVFPRAIEGPGPGLRGGWLPAWLAPVLSSRARSTRGLGCSHSRSPGPLALTLATRLPHPSSHHSPSPQSGFYDNNKGLDYHVPIKGGTGSIPTLRVVHVAAEMAPIAKVGWLGGLLRVPAGGRARPAAARERKENGCTQPPPRQLTTRTHPSVASPRRRAGWATW